MDLRTGLVLYGAGSLLGTGAYFAVIIFQQFMGSALSKIFFTMNYDELMINACYSGLWALVFMFTGHEKYKNLLISLLPAMTYLASARGGFSHVLNTFDISMFTTYETPLVLIAFALFWGLGLPKIVNQG